MFVAKGPSCFRRHCCCHIGALILCLVNISLGCLTIKDIAKIYTSELTFSGVMDTGTDARNDGAMFIYQKYWLHDPYRIRWNRYINDNKTIYSAKYSAIYNRIYIGQAEELHSLKDGTLEKIVPCDVVWPFEKHFSLHIFLKIKNDRGCTMVFQFSFKEHLIIGYGFNFKPPSCEEYAYVTPYYYPAGCNFNIVFNNQVREDIVRYKCSNENKTKERICRQLSPADITPPDQPALLTAQPKWYLVLHDKESTDPCRYDAGFHRNFIKFCYKDKPLVNNTANGTYPRFIV